MKEEVRRKKEEVRNESATPPGPGGAERLPVVTASEPPQPAANERSSLRDDTTPKSRTRSEALREYWRDVKAGARTRRGMPREVPRDPARNPLLDLPDEQRSRIYAWLRDCPYLDAAQDLLKKEGIHGVTPRQITEFYESETNYQADVRFVRAAEEANALVKRAEESEANFSGAILAKLGQEVFRLVSSGQLDASTINRLGTLFLKARGDDRAAQMQGLKREKLEQDLKESVHDALEVLSRQVQGHPEAQVAFKTLCDEMSFDVEEA